MKQCGCMSATGTLSPHQPRITASCPAASHEKKTATRATPPSSLSAEHHAPQAQGGHRTGGCSGHGVPALPGQSQGPGHDTCTAPCAPPHVTPAGSRVLSSYLSCQLGTGKYFVPIITVFVIHASSPSPSHPQGIVHFDLKCDNLLCDLRDLMRPVVKVRVGAAALVGPAPAMSKLLSQPACLLFMTRRHPSCLFFQKHVLPWQPTAKHTNRPAVSARLAPQHRHADRGPRSEQSQGPGPLLCVCQYEGDTALDGAWCVAKDSFPPCPVSCICLPAVLSLLLPAAALFHRAVPERS